MFFFPPPQSFESKLVSHLKVTDLCQSRKHLLAKIDALCAPNLSNENLHQVRGLKYGWVFSIDNEETLSLSAILLTEFHHKVQVTYLNEPYGGAPLEFRYVQTKSGPRLIGVLNVQGGNTYHAGATILRLKSSGWETLWSYSSIHEGRTEFMSRESNDISCKIRDYKFKVFNQPHVGPLLTMQSTWRFRNGRFQIGKAHRLRNALYAFDDLVYDLQHRHWKRVYMRCPNSTMRRKLARDFMDIGTGGFLQCPMDNELDDGRVFGIDTSDFYEMGLVKGVWQVIRVAPESYFIKRDHIAND